MKELINNQKYKIIFTMSFSEFFNNHINIQEKIDEYFSNNIDNNLIIEKYFIGVHI
jgi:hypothetical protein